MAVFDNPEELKPLVGREISVSDWHVVPQDMIGAFAKVTGDAQWIHLDVERAGRESPYGTTIAHGFLTLSLITQLHAGNVRFEPPRRTINYGLNRVRFPAPVRAGARIRAHSLLQAWEQFAEAVQLTWQITVEVEGQEKPAVVAEWIVRHYPQ